MEDSQAHRFYDEVADVYDSRYQDPFSLLYDDITWANLTSFLPTRGDSWILDAGGGTGYCAIPLAQRGYHVTIVDMSLRMLNVARSRLMKAGIHDRVDIVHGDLRRLEMFQDNTFDMVVCQGSVLSCCERYQDALRELARVAKHGSHVNVSVHHRYGWVSFLIEKGRSVDVPELVENGNFVWIEGQYPRHPLHAFTVDEILSELATVGIHPTRIIGKVVLPQHIIEPFLSDKRMRSHLFELALAYADQKELFALARYIDITGPKL